MLEAGLLKYPFIFTSEYLLPPLINDICDGTTVSEHRSCYICVSENGETDYLFIAIVIIYESVFRHNVPVFLDLMISRPPLSGSPWVMCPCSGGAAGLGLGLAPVWVCDTCSRMVTSLPWVQRGSTLRLNEGRSFTETYLLSPRVCYSVVCQNSVHCRVVRR